MDRIKLVQQIINRGSFENYLEVGCQSGTSLLPLRVKNKIAVDPLFKIPTIKKWKWLIMEPTNKRNRYYEEESDVFFQKRKEELEKLKQLDVVLIDGLHTFANSLRDVLNALRYLNKDGVIVMHDCFPPSAAAAFPTDHFPDPEEQQQIEGWTGEWCGDVWKTIVYLRIHCSDFLNVCVINTDYGLGVIRFEPEVESDDLDLTIDTLLFDKINKITYDNMRGSAEGVLNLKPVKYVDTILKEIVPGKNSI